MAEIWNPFDDKNPVYKQLAKQTAITNKTWRLVGSIAVLIVVADFAGKRGYNISGLGRVKNNPYGIIRK